MEERFSIKRNLVIILDVHGRSFWRDAVDARPDNEFIFLGDFLDPYPQDYLDCSRAFVLDRVTGHITGYERMSAYRKRYNHQLLRQLLNWRNLSFACKGLFWIVRASMRVVIERSVIQYGGWEREKKDILGRLDWLCERIIVEPEALFLGE